MAELLASQNVLANMTDKFGGRLPVRVYFLDNSSKLFLLDSSASVADLISNVLLKFDVKDHDHFIPYFGLFESLNGASVDAVRTMDERVGSILDEWSSQGHTNAKFVFMIRLFVPSTYGLEYEDELSRSLQRKLTLTEYLSIAKIRDSGLFGFQYMQAVYSIVTGQYPATEELALKLGTFHFLQKFGSYNSSSHQPGFLGGRVVEFIPLKLLKQKSLEEWEQALLDVVEDRATNFEYASSSSEDPRRLYMNEIFPLIPYGCTLFRCKVSTAATTSPSARAIPPDCILGVHHLGIHVFDKGSSRKLVKSFRIEEIARWGFKPSELFYFDIQAGPDVTGILEFQTADGKKIADLLTDYSLVYVKEREREELRAASNQPDPEASSTSGDKAKDKGKEKDKEKDKEKEAPRRKSTSKTVKIETESRHADPVPEAVVAPKPVPVSAPVAPPPAPVPKQTKAAAPAAPVKSAAAIKAEKKMLKAAVKIQSLFRGFQVRNEWAREDAAILIQASYRGYRDRVIVSNMIEQMLDEDYE